MFGHTEAEIKQLAMASVGGMILQTQGWIAKLQADVAILQVQVETLRKALNDKERKQP